MTRRTILGLAPATTTNDDDLLLIRQGGEDRRVSVSTLADRFETDIPTATTVRSGVLEIATQQEAIAGSDNQRAITPAGVNSYFLNNSVTERIQDVVGAMFTGNTEVNIFATYDDADGDINLRVNDASQSNRGAIRLALNSEVQTGTGTDTAITPAGLESKTATLTRRGILELASNAEVISGQDTTKAVTPAGLEARIRNSAGGAIGSYVLGIAPTNVADGVELTVSSGTQFSGGGIQTIEPLRDSLTPYSRPNELMGTWVYIGPSQSVGPVGLLSGLFYRIA